MSNENIRVYGNVVLASRAAGTVQQHRVPETRPMLSVVDGSRRASVVAQERQLLAADAFASRSAKVASPGSMVRAVVVGAVAVILLCALTTVHGTVLASTEAAAISAVDRSEVTVAAGDSLWSIAEAHPIEGLDASRTVELIREWNELESPMLRVGMELSVPVAR